MRRREHCGAVCVCGGAVGVKKGRVSRFKEGFSHYDSATVYCILQRPYYDVVLAFMLTFRLRVQHLHGKQGQELLRGGLVEDHNAGEGNEDTFWSEESQEMNYNYYLCLNSMVIEESKCTATLDVHVE